jgi:S1-C subfamily serine protease
MNPLSSLIAAVLSRRQTVAFALWSVLLAVVLASCQALTASSGSPGATSSATATVTTTSGAVPVPGIDRLREQAINRVTNSVVKINIGSALGSGVILTGNGYIVTNHHVVSGASTINVTLANGDTFPARLVGSDTVDDLAVVKIARTGLPTASLGNSNDLTVGQTVLAIGNPLGITRTVTDGIVSALNRTVSEGQGTNGSIPNAIQTSAAINPGNSGGALINLAGQVIGVPTLAAVDPEFGTQAPGIGFAIPSNTVARISQQIIRYHKVLHSGRAALGVFVESVNPQLAAQYNLPVQHGALVAGTQAGGAAAKAGIKKNDVIVQFNGSRIGSESSLLGVLARRSPGDRVTVTVVTPKGTHQTYHVTLGELPANPTTG